MTTNHFTVGPDHAPRCDNAPSKGALLNEQPYEYKRNFNTLEADIKNISFFLLQAFACAELLLTLACCSFVFLPLVVL